MSVERMTALYMRVSDKKQDTASQEPEIIQWVKAYAEDKPRQWYQDKMTGKTMDRPGWNKLEADIDRGKIERVVVWRIDRLGRTASGLTALFDKLVRLNIGLVSIKDGLDLTTPAGRLIANVLASVAAYENEVRSERILAGQAAARAKGKRWGGSKKGHRKVNFDQIEMISLMNAKGCTKAAMARATNLSRETVRVVVREVT